MDCSLLLAESEREADATLQDALAFIDSFEGEPVTSESNAPSSEVTKAKRAPRGGGRHKKKRSHSERVKSELWRLRDDAEMLESTLKRLKQQSLVRSARNQLARHWSPSAASHFDLHGMGSPRAVLAKWMEIFVEEYRLRCESEAMNRRLRAMLSTQFSVMQAAQGMLSSNADAAAPSESEPFADQQQTLAKSLSSRLGQLQLDVDNVLRRSGITHVESYFAWSQFKHDETLGVLLESTFCLPVPLDLEQTRSALLSHSPCKVVKCMELMKNGTDSDQITSAEVEHDDQLYELATKTTFRKICEHDRIIYVWSALVSLSGKQWVFHEDGITVMRRAAGDASTSLLQNWHRVRVEQSGTPNASNALQETILSLLSNRVRDHLGKFKSSMERITRVKLC